MIESLENDGKRALGPTDILSGWGEPGSEGVVCPSCKAVYAVPHGGSPRGYVCSCGAQFTPARRDSPHGILETRGGEASPAETPESLGPVAAGNPAAAGPNRFGQYELLEEIGRGGMGVVYRARQIGLKREVALKMLLSGEGATEEEIARFQMEARAASKLEHPGIVQVFDVGEADGRHYFTMALVKGESVEDLLDRMGIVPPRVALKIVREACLALHHAHEKGVVHRDVKPGNILIARDGADGPDPRGDDGEAAGLGSGMKAMVADFGLARDMTGKSGLTLSGMALGTPVYMSPEQADGDRDRIGPVSDVYSLGAVLYEMVTGEPPFSGSHAGQILAQVITRDPAPPRRRLPGLHRDVETIILKAMSKEPARRYRSALKMAQDIFRYLAGEAIQARRASPVYRLFRWSRRHRAVSIAAALALLVVGMTVFLGVRDRTLKRRATTGKAITLVTEGYRILAMGDADSAERSFQRAVFLMPSAKPAKRGITRARFSRLVMKVEDRIRSKAFDTAGYLLEQARKLVPDDPELDRLERLQKGTASFSIEAQDPGWSAYFAEVSVERLWADEALPSLAACRDAGLIKPVGTLPVDGLDIPFGDRWLLLEKGGRLQKALYLPVPRSAKLAYRLESHVADASGQLGPASINAVIRKARPGAVIEIRPGTYRETVVIRKRGITLRGDPEDMPVIIAATDKPALDGRGAAGLRIEHCDFRSVKSHVIKVERSPGTVLTGCRFSGGNTRMVMLKESPHSLVIDNVIQNSAKPGLNVSESDGSIVAGNVIRRVGWGGFLFENSSRARIVGNNLSNNAMMGAFAVGCENSEMFWNYAEGNVQWGFCIGERCTGIRFHDNVAVNNRYNRQGQLARGLTVGFNVGTRVEHNTLIGNDVGLHLQKVDDTVYADNLIVGNDSSLWFEDAPRCSPGLNGITGHKVFARWKRKPFRTQETLVGMWDDPADRKFFDVVTGEPVFRDRDGHDFAVDPKSPYHGAASDGKDLGADWEKVEPVYQGRFDTVGWLKELLRLETSE